MLAVASVRINHSFILSQISSMGQSPTVNKLVILRYYMNKRRKQN